ncbi:MAG: hypothetical protein IT447_07165 [Phycisphaerales bacterium]|jgi:drug/metabolite transporter (DMT)-like permease|nr:hypothetical protein [Phycisphaerales bacterium]
MQWLPAIFALLAGAAGWYYLFYSKAAEALRSVEGERVNNRRMLLRRINGLMMLLLAVAFFAGFRTVDEKSSPVAYLLIWLAALILLAIIVILAMVDMRLTMNLRRRQNKDQR